MAITRLGLSGTPRPALSAGDAVAIAANLAQWDWTPLAASVAADKVVVGNLAQWAWTPLSAGVVSESTINASLAQWQWTPLAADISLATSVTTTASQWAWTALPADVSTAAAEITVSANLAQWSWSGLSAGVTDGSAVAPTGGGRGSKKAKGKYPRKIVIDGVVYYVNSAAEERRLLAQHQAKVEADALMLAVSDAPETVVKKARVKVKRAAARLEAVDTREADWLQRLRDEDEEILMVVMH